jgi:nitrite reductase/ring-hydroxylating ferredoxin subunit
MRSFTLTTLAFLGALVYSNAFSVRREAMTMKRGRGSFGKEFGEGKPAGLKSPSSAGMSDSVGSSSSRWVPVQGVTSIKDLPTEEGKVMLMDTMAEALKNGATNPTGAVAVIKYGPATYCTAVACSSCKIPLNKAKILESNDETGRDPRIVCDFCAATFNLRTGERITSKGGNGIFGGIAKALFAAQSSDNLKVYALGEKDGRVLINLD